VLSSKNVLTMEHFSRVSNVYNQVRTTDLEPIDYIKSRLGRWGKIIAGEVGAGGGRYSALLLQEIPNLHLTCFDMNQSMLEEAGHFLLANGAGNFKLAQAESAALSLENDSLDCLLTFNAVHHFDLIPFLEEAGRVLRDKGLLFIYTRLPSQNKTHIWGRYFPDFTKVESRLNTLNQMEKSLQNVPALALDSVQVFRYPRSAPLERLLHQAVSGHYSTFSLYNEEPFERALSQFEVNLKRAFPGNEEITWTAENILVVARASKK
jgi:ubiquinone/menaquinone biosynthesis C-methylase UbiE